jgi:Na+-driven multidrug efflux pump
MLNSMTDDGPRDPKQVRRWGWVAFAIAVVIALIYAFIEHPWTK